ncbi:MAG: FadR family transcriptional regulator [Rhodobacteraceae bacterium]|nr:FadR family transcriptional regulator [Paracoccaceae bacterium]
MPDTPPRKLNAVDIAALIRSDISKGRYHVNDRLPPERQMAELHRVARGTIRGALTRLEQEGLVEIKPGSGAYVIDGTGPATSPAIELATPLELMDARFALEPHICRLTVLNGRRADFEKLESLCTRMEQSTGDPIGFADADTEFHRTLVESTRNGLLVWIIEQVTSVRLLDDWMRMRQLTLNEKIISTYNRQHRQLLNAIRAREPERAANLMKEHLESARLTLTRASET